YEDDRRRGGVERWLDDLIRRLVANGIRSLIVPPGLREHQAVWHASRHAYERFVMVDTEVRGPRPFAVPTLIVLGPGDRLMNSWLPPIESGPPRITFMSAATPDPAKPGARVAEWRSPVIDVEDLIARI